MMRIGDDALAQFLGEQPMAITAAALGFKSLVIFPSHRHHIFRWFHRHDWRRVRPILVIGNFAVELLPHKEITMAAALQVGQSVPLTIAFLDQSGSPMETTPTPDSPPTWNNTTPATETLMVADGGMSATLLALAAGEDSVTLSLTVGGVSFSASLAVTVTAEAPPAQVLTSIGIAVGTPTGA